MEPILVQVAIYLGAAVVAVPLSQRLGFGSVLGYLLAGMAIGPALGLVGRETDNVQEYAEYGVVLMLFLIGLEMKPRALWELRARLLGLGGLQVALTLALVAAATRALGLPWNQAVAVGIILSLSSTAIVMQTLAERKLLLGEGGRASLAVLLFQDIAAIPLLAVIPLLALGGAPAVEAHLGAAMLDQVPPAVRALLVVAACGLMIVGGRYLPRPLYRFLAMARLPEIQLAGALLVIVLVSIVMATLGLSPALGSFLIGVALASSPFRHQLEADIGPFKGILLGLFFITVGAGIDLARLAAEPLRILALTLAFMALKIAVLWLLALAFGLGRRARLLFTLGLAQAGEFSFFLLGFARASQRPRRRRRPAPPARHRPVDGAHPGALPPRRRPRPAPPCRAHPRPRRHRRDRHGHRRRHGPLRPDREPHADRPRPPHRRPRFRTSRPSSGCAPSASPPSTATSPAPRCSSPPASPRPRPSSSPSTTRPAPSRWPASSAADGPTSGSSPAPATATMSTSSTPPAFPTASARSSTAPCAPASTRSARSVTAPSRSRTSPRSSSARTAACSRSSPSSGAPTCPIEDNPAYLAKAREQTAVIEAALRGRAASSAPPAAPERRTARPRKDDLVHRSDSVASQQPPH